MTIALALIALLLVAHAEGEMTSDDDFDSATRLPAIPWVPPLGERTRMRGGDARVQPHAHDVPEGGVERLRSLIVYSV